MPNLKSAKKALRRSIFLRERNNKFKIAMKKSIKEFLKILNNKELALEKIKEVYSKIDKCAKRNIIHKNKAARLKSKLMKKIQASIAQ